MSDTGCPIREWFDMDNNFFLNVVETPSDESSIIWN